MKEKFSKKIEEWPKKVSKVGKEVSEAHITATMPTSRECLTIALLKCKDPNITTSETSSLDSIAGNIKNDSSIKDAPTGSTRDNH